VLRFLFLFLLGAFLFLLLSLCRPTPHASSFLVCTGRKTLPRGEGNAFS